MHGVRSYVLQLVLLFVCVLAYALIMGTSRDDHGSLVFDRTECERWLLYWAVGNGIALLAHVGNQ